MFEQFDLSKYGGKQIWAALTELNRLLTKHLPKTLEHVQLACSPARRCRSSTAPSSHAPAHEVLGVQLLDALLRVDGAVVAY